ncbi:MAG TPA: YdcH family protein [Thermohalobaculum sp.]|nr:YdcH family protein [Thermohalobaculum sp.]
MKVMNQGELLIAQLMELRRQHRALDEEIAELSANVLGDQLQVKRLKIRKLQLKDEIARVEDKLYPDIIA